MKNLKIKALFTLALVAFMATSAFAQIVSPGDINRLRGLNIHSATETVTGTLTVTGKVVASTGTFDVAPGFSTTLLANNGDKQTVGSLTLAQVNTGTTILTGVTGRQIYVVGFDLVATGTPITCTGVYLEDTNGTPVVAATALIAALTSGTHVFPTTSNAGAGFGSGGLTSGAGLQIKVDGSNCATMTALAYQIEYVVK